MHFNQGKEGKVEQEGNTLRYTPTKDECGSDTFTYWIQDLDDGLRDSADVHIEIVCPPQYGQESTIDYTEEQISILMDKLGDIACKSKSDTFDD